MAWRRPGKGLLVSETRVDHGEFPSNAIGSINKLHQLMCIFHLGAAKPLPLGTTLMVLIRFCGFSRKGRVS